MSTTKSWIAQFLWNEWYLAAAWLLAWFWGSLGDWWNEVCDLLIRGSSCRSGFFLRSFTEKSCSSSPQRYLWCDSVTVFWPEQRLPPWFAPESLYARLGNILLCPGWTDIDTGLEQDILNDKNAQPNDYDWPQPASNENRETLLYRLTSPPDYYETACEGARPEPKSILHQAILWSFWLSAAR